MASLRFLLLSSLAILLIGTIRGEGEVTMAPPADDADSVTVGGDGDTPVDCSTVASCRMEVMTLSQPMKDDGSMDFEALCANKAQLAMTSAECKATAESCGDTETAGQIDVITTQTGQMTAQYCPEDGTAGGGEGCGVAEMMPKVGECTNKLSETMPMGENTENLDEETICSAFQEYLTCVETATGECRLPMLEEPLQQQLNDFNASCPVTFRGQTYGGDEVEAEVVEETIVAENVDQSACSQVASQFTFCNTKLEGEVTCEKLDEYDVCVEGAVTGCDDESIKEEVKTQAEEKRETAEESMEGSCDDDAVGDLHTTSQLPVVENKFITTTAQAPADMASTNKASVEDDDKVIPEESEDSHHGHELKIPPEEEEVTPLPLCEDADAKAAEAQKCNDEFNTKGPFCIQMQKVADCVETAVDCSSEAFDSEVEKYLDSLEEYLTEHDCIITYRGNRLEDRIKMEKDDKDSGSGKVTMTIFTIVSTILTGLALIR